MADKNYEMVNHPKHYNNYDKEVIDMMVDIWGLEKTAVWCEMTAFRYRMRMGTKPDNPMEQDFNKEKWYLDKKRELENLIESKKSISGNGPKNPGPLYS